MGPLPSGWETETQNVSGSLASAQGGKGAKDKPPQRAMRPRELQDPLNHFVYHPLAWRLALVLRHTPITPNMVSLLGALMVVGAAICYVGLAWPLSAALGMALHMGWHVVDGADGDLARLTGRASPVGEMVDGLCDYLSHVVLYLILGWYMAHQPGLVTGWQAWVLMLVAGLGHAVQSNHVEVQRRQYQYWVYGTPWIRMSHSEGDSATSRSWAAGLVSGYLKVASGMTPHALKIDAAIEAAKGDRARLDAIAAAVRAEAPPLLLVCKVLGPNPRAVVLGLSMFAGSPVWYMFYQAVVLNLLMLVSVRMHNAAAQRIAARIGA